MTRATKARRTSCEEVARWDLGVHLTTQDAANFADATGQANALSAHGCTCYLANPVDATNLVQPLIEAERQHRLRARMAAEVRSALSTLSVNVPSPKARVRRLSGGQRQAVAIARSASFGTKLVIMDEPPPLLAYRRRRVLRRLSCGCVTKGSRF